MRRLFLGVLATLLLLGLLGLAVVFQPLAGSLAPVAPLPRADPERLRAHVVNLVEGFPGRHTGDLASLERVAAFLRAQLEAQGLRVEEQPFRLPHGVIRNLAAHLGPVTGPQWVVGAHYDVHGQLPGADDNASGVAGVLELARVLKGVALPAGLELALFAPEEQPYFKTASMGSLVHAFSLRRRGVDVRAMISLEMIGCFSDAAGSQDAPWGAGWVFPSVGNFALVVGDLEGLALTRAVKRAMQGATPLPVRSVNAPRFVDGISTSDHVGFWEQGFPAVMVTDTAYLRNGRYHSAQDTPDTLDYARMAQVVDGVAQAVLAP